MIGIVSEIIIYVEGEKQFFCSKGDSIFSNSLSDQHGYNHLG